MSHILIVDDEAAISWSLREVLQDEGHSVEVAASVAEALEICVRITPEVMLLDVRLPGRDGLESLPDFRALLPAARIIVMTAFGDLDTAVRAVKAGAFDYLVKPFDLARVSAVVARGIADHSARLAHSADTSDGADTTATTHASLIGRTLPMQTVFKQIALVSPSDLPVLLTGETGTGKELAARAIHMHSPRHERPLVVTSLAALAPSVIESELFGHLRGAFTGATVDRKGLFELADGGTIFLDEIGEASPEVQVKLLRVLEHGEITPVGSATRRPVDVRVIAATNRNLEAAMATGGFREDLFHRLRVFPIEMPALATRLEDLPTLVTHFLQRSSVTVEVPPSAAFLECLRDRPWPGNVRQLKHAVEYAAVMARGGRLQPEHLPPETPRTLLQGVSVSGAAIPSDALLAGEADALVAAAIRAWVTSIWNQREAESDPLHQRLLKLVEMTLVEEVVDRAGGNRTAAAKILGLDRATLRGKLER